MPNQTKEHRTLTMSRHFKPVTFTRSKSGQDMLYSRPKYALNHTVCALKHILAENKAYFCRARMTRSRDRADGKIRSCCRLLQLNNFVCDLTITLPFGKGTAQVERTWLSPCRVAVPASEAGRLFLTNGSV
jgi:hypothetical protein